MRTVALPMNTKVRDLDGTILLALRLLEEDCRVAIGQRTRLREVIDFINPDIYFDLNAMEKHSSVFRRYNEQGTKIAILDTEGAVFPSMDYFAENRLSNSSLSGVHTYFAWGEKTADVVRDYSSHSCDVFAFGHPSFDLCKEEFRNIYAEEARSYRRHFGKYILINTNFRSANDAGTSEQLSETLPVPYLRNADIDSRHCQRIGLDYLMLGSFLHMIDHVASHFPDYSIIIRPHPAENVEFYENMLTGVENVSVQHEGSVRPWIIGAKAVVHNACTTGIEAALLNTPAISFESFEFQRPPNQYTRADYLPRLVSVSVETSEELVEVLANVVESDKQYRLPGSERAELDKFIRNSDIKSSTEIARVVKHISTGDAQNQSDTPSATNQVKELIRAPARRATREVRRRVGNLHHQFPELRREEIEMTVQALDVCEDFATSDVAVKPVTPWNEVYWIYQRN